jgi:hypothetical protein
MSETVIAPPIDDTRRGICDSITKVLANEGEFTIDKIELIYTPQGPFKRDPLRIFRRASEPDRPFFARDGSGAGRMTSEIISLAERQVDILNRADRFKLLFSAANGDRSFFPFAVAPEYASEGGGEIEVISNDRHEPTEGTVIKAVMQQNRELHMSMQQMLGGFMGAMNNALAQLEKQNTSLLESQRVRDENHAKMLIEIEEARSKKHEREIEAGIVASKLERQEFAMKKVMTLVPTVLSRMLSPGDKESDKKKDPSEIAVAMLAFAGSLLPEQKMKLGAVFSVEQMITLGEAARVAKLGGSEMLASLVHDLVGTLTKAHLERLFGSGDEPGVLDEGQGQALVKLMTIAKRDVEKLEAGGKPAATTSSAPLSASVAL